MRHVNWSERAKCRGFGVQTFVYTITTALYTAKFSPNYSLE
jgi:hypothetical protein